MMLRLLTNKGSVHAKKWWKNSVLHFEYEIIVYVTNLKEIFLSHYSHINLHLKKHIKKKFKVGSVEKSNKYAIWFLL